VLQSKCFDRSERSDTSVGIPLIFERPSRLCPRLQPSHEGGLMAKKKTKKKGGKKKGTKN
jgi:hypothetical protein